jgi:CheY-like chemotaxis protein
MTPRIAHGADLQTHLTGTMARCVVNPYLEFTNMERRAIEEDVDRWLALDRQAEHRPLLHRVVVEEQVVGVKMNRGVEHALRDMNAADVIHMRMGEKDGANRHVELPGDLDELVDLVAWIEQHGLAGRRTADDIAVLHEWWYGADFEDHGHMVMCVLDDLLLSVKISTAAKLLGAPIYFERKPDAVLESVRERQPRLVVFDLNSVRMQPLTTIASLKGDPALRDVRVVGFVSHVDADTIQAARQAGTDEIVARSAFFDRLPEWLTPA